MSLGSPTVAPAVRVAVLSDDRLFAEGLIRIIASESFAAVVHQQQRPDILLADSRMNGQLNSLFKMCAGFRGDCGGPAVIFVAAPEDDSWASDALAAGARGILPRSARADDLLNAVKVVYQGLIWAPRRVMAAAIERLVRTPSINASADAALEERLSTREREVFRHAATGACNKELADRLEISESTVKVHMTRIFQKLGVQSRAELAAAYHRLIPVTVQRRDIRLSE